MLEELGITEEQFREIAESLLKQLPPPIVGRKYGDLEAIEGPTRFKTATTTCYRMHLRCKCGRTLWATDAALRKITMCRQCRYVAKHGPDGMKRMHRNAVAGADPRGLVVAITEDYMRRLFAIQGGRCRLTGVQLTIGHRPSEETTASLDRIDSKLGYLRGNVQWVHKDVNILNGPWPDEKLIYWARMIADHSRRKPTRRPGGTGQQSLDFGSPAG